MERVRKMIGHEDEERRVDERKGMKRKLNNFKNFF